MPGNMNGNGGCLLKERKGNEEGNMVTFAHFQDDLIHSYFSSSSF